MTLQHVFDAILGQAGVIVLLLVIVWAGWKRIWIFGWYHVEMQAELRSQIAKLEARIAQGNSTKPTVGSQPSTAPQKDNGDLMDGVNRMLGLRTSGPLLEQFE